MMKKTFLFYSYDALGRDVVIPVEAVDRDDAFEVFDFHYGPDTPIDCVVEKQQEFTTDTN